jgi:hypothetical protein
MNDVVEVTIDQFSDRVLLEELASREWTDDEAYSIIEDLFPSLNAENLVEKVKELFL